MRSKSSGFRQRQSLDRCSHVKKTSEFPDEVCATLSGHRFLIAFRDGSLTEDTENLVAALIVEATKIAIRDVRLKLLALVELRFAIVGHIPIRLHILFADVVLICLQCL